MEFSQQIITVLDYLFKKFGVVVDWTSKTMMPYLEELAKKYITYKISLDYFWIGIGIALIIAAIIAGVIAFKVCYDDNFVPILILVVGIGLGLVIIACNIYNIIECKTFPEKVLFDYIKSLSSNGGSKPWWN